MNGDNQGDNAKMQKEFYSKKMTTLKNRTSYTDSILKSHSLLSGKSFGL
jgi:hypothetical protein